MTLKPEGASYLTDALHQGNVFHFFRKNNKYFGFIKPLGTGWSVIQLLVDINQSKGHQTFTDFQSCYWRFTANKKWLFPPDLDPHKS